jgi:hypothetical protein
MSRDRNSRDRDITHVGDDDRDDVSWKTPPVIVIAPRRAPAQLAHPRLVRRFALGTMPPPTPWPEGD